MSIDPYRDMATWLDMTPAEEARLRHPAGKSIRESAEVAEERMNREACALGSSNATPRPAPVHPVVEVARAVVAGLTVYGVIFATLTGPHMVAGWIA